MPLAILWFGVSEAAPGFLIFLGAFFPIVVASSNGVRSVPAMYLQAGRNFGLSTPRLLARVVFPAALPQILVGLRIALGIAWLVVVAAEMIAVDSGLGYLIIDSRNAGKRYDLVVAGMLLIGVIGLVLDLVVRRLERLRACAGASRQRRHDGRRSASAFGVGAWLLVVTALHSVLNVNWAVLANDFLSPDKRKLNVAYIPVTCHLACPVTDYISKFSEAGELFVPRMFQGFPEIKESLIANKMQAAFIVAPMAIALKAQGVGIRIVYLGHRYGSAVVVRKDGPVKTFPDLKGRDDRGAEPVLGRAAHRLSRPEEVRHEAGRPEDRRDGAAGRDGRARGGGHRRVLHGRAVPLPGRARRIRPRPVPRARALAGLHVVRPRGPRGRHRLPPRGRPDARRRHRALGSLAGGGQAAPRPRRGLRRALLLQPEPEDPPMGPDEPARPRHVHAALAAEERTSTSCATS